MSWRSPLCDEIPKNEIVLPNFHLLLYETAVYNISELIDEEKKESFWIVEVVLFVTQDPPKAIIIPLDFGYKFSKPSIAFHFLQMHGQLFHNVSSIVTVQGADKQIIGEFDLSVPYSPPEEGENLPEPTSSGSHLIQ
jgi:hypothetical protein